MAYQIIKSDGTLLLELADGFVDTASASLTFIGKNYSKFGELQNDNFLHLLENFASGREPANKLKGQLWFNTGTNAIQAYDGHQWQQLAVVSVAPTSTAASTKSNFWYDINNNQLFINTGTAFVLIGPEKAPGFNPTRFISATLLDIYDTPNPVIECLIDDEVVFIVSRTDFVTSSSNVISGISHIRRGITYKDGDNPLGNVSLVGTSLYATNATKLESDGGEYIPATALDTPTTIVQRDIYGGIVATGVTTNLLRATPNGIIEGNWTVNETLIPDLNGGAALGASSRRWSSVYSQSVDTTVLNADISTFIQLKDKKLRYIDQFDNDTLLAADSEFRLPTQHAVKYYVDNKYSGIQNEIDSLVPASIPAVANTLLKRDSSASGFVNTLTATTLSLTGSPATKISGFDPDPLLAANSDLKLATQKAIKKYIDDAVALEISNRISGDNNLQNEINALQAIPTGTIFYTAGSAVPSGYFSANGQALSKTTYTNLYNALGGSGSPYGQTLTTFNVPDLRGEFIRGWDNGRGIDAGRALGTTQADSVGPHQHDFTDVFAIVGDYGLGPSTAPNTDRNGAYLQKAFYAANATDNDNDNGVYGFPSRTDVTGLSIAAETRAKNVALQAIIKY